MSDNEPTIDTAADAPIIDGHGTGLIPSPPDDRDYLIRDLLAEVGEDRTIRPTPRPTPAPRVISRKTVDLRAKMPPVWSQGGEGACTSSVADCHVYVDKDLGLGMPSHAATWAWTKLRGGAENVAKNVGAGVRDAMLSTRDWGVAPDEMYPFKHPNPRTLPPQRVADAAGGNQSIAFFKLEPRNREELVRTLSVLRLPVAFGLGLWQGWGPRNTGRIQRRPATPEIIGYHLMVVVGYKTLADGVWLLIRNSWSEGWGGRSYGGVRYDAGHAYMHIDDFLPFAFDCYSIASVEGGMVAGTGVPVESFRND